MSDAPPKTLSSRSQTLSKLQPVEPPQRTPNEDRPNPEDGCRRPRAPRRQKDRFSAPNRQNKQSRIVLLAPLPGERKPAIRSHTCNALIPRQAAIYSDISCGTSGSPATPCRSRFSSPTSPRTPERFCGSAPAWTWPPILSSRPAFRPRPELPPGRNGLPRPGQPDPPQLLVEIRAMAPRRRPPAGAVHHQGRPVPTLITATNRPISCCSDASPPASPTRSWRPPMRG